MVGTLELNHIVFTIRRNIQVISFVYGLRAVSLFLENPWERMQNKCACVLA